MNALAQPCLRRQLVQTLPLTLGPRPLYNYVFQEDDGVRVSTYDARTLGEADYKSESLVTIVTNNPDAIGSYWNTVDGSVVVQYWDSTTQTSLGDFTSPSAGFEGGYTLNDGVTSVSYSNSFPLASGRVDSKRCPDPTFS